MNTPWPCDVVVVVVVVEGIFMSITFANSQRERAGWVQSYASNSHEI